MAVDDPRNAPAADKRKADKVTPGGEGNSVVAVNQRKRFYFLAGGSIIALIGLSLYMNRPDPTPEIGPGGARVRMTDAVARNPGDSEAFKGLNTEVQGLQRSFEEFRKQNQSTNETLARVEQLLKGEENADEQLYADVESLARQVADLRRQLANQPDPSTLPRTASSGVGQVGAAGGAQPGSPTSVGVGGLPRRGGASPQAPGLAAGAYPPAPVQPPARRTQQVIVLKSDAGEAAVEEFDKDVNGNLTEAEEPEVFRTEDYVPPNAYAPAKVYVGVDAATGQQAQADPQAAAFIITGKARHVVIDGEIQETDLEGCIVNGAARGDLSTERVFIKLQKMTCPLSDGRVSVQQVEGHVTQLGKAGVRGVIVSRVGDRVNKAAIASALSGLGNALGGAARPGVGIGGGGSVIQEVPNTEELAIATGGAAVSGAADQLASYYIDQAKAIQPVVSMPTGVDVELVFISGFKARPTEEDEG